MAKSRAADAKTSRPARADARRNYDQILAAAVEAISESGADASLEEIARRAGVGSATLHRHFRSRRALLEAVFTPRVEALCVESRELAKAADGADQSLVAWLHSVGSYVASTKGLAESLAAETGEIYDGSGVYATVCESGGELLRVAQSTGLVRPDIGITDLINLILGISLATSEGPKGKAEADRLLTIALEGIRHTRK